jgi:probable HAF family extracellular repeat protein
MNLLIGSIRGGRRDLAEEEVPMSKRSVTLLDHAGAFVLCTLVALPVIAEAPKVQVNDLGTLGGRFTVVADINDVGEVTGYSEASDGQIRAFIYTRGQMHDLGTLGGPGSLATAINDAGQITGFSLTASGGAHAFLYTAGTMTDLGTSGTTSSGKAINHAGQVAGEATPSGGHKYAVLYSDGGVNTFGTLGSTSTSEAISEQGLVTGTYEDGNGSHAFVYAGQSIIDLMPGYSSFVSGTRAINTSGAVAGGFQIGGTLHGFLYAQGRTTDIGSLGGDYTVATAISSAGKITGISARADGQRHAFIYSAGTLADLGTLGGSLSVGYALNELDQVAGESMTSSGQLHAFVSQEGMLLDLGQLVEGLNPSASVVESFGVGINRDGQVIGRYTISTPSDTQMPTKIRSFITTTTASATALFQDLIASVVGIGPGKSLANKAQQALSAYLAGDTHKSCSRLDGFAHEVEAQDGKKIEHQTALSLLQQSDALRSVLGCSP